MRICIGWLNIDMTPIAEAKVAGYYVGVRRVCGSSALLVCHSLRVLNRRDDVQQSVINPRVSFALPEYSRPVVAGL